MPVGAQLAQQRMQPRIYGGTRAHRLEAGVVVLLVEDAGGRPAGAAARAAQAGAVAQVQAGRAAPGGVLGDLVDVLPHARPQARATPCAALAAQQVAARAQRHRLVRPLVPAAQQASVRNMNLQSKTEDNLKQTWQAGIDAGAATRMPRHTLALTGRHSHPQRQLWGARGDRQNRRACRSGRCGTRGSPAHAPSRTFRGSAARGTAAAPRTAARAAHALGRRTPWTAAQRLPRNPMMLGPSTI